MQNVLTSGGQLLHRAARYEKQDEKDDVQGVKECQAGFSRFLMAFIEEQKSGKKLEKSVDKAMLLWYIK